MWKSRVDWAAAYAAFKESGLTTIAEFYRKRLAEFVVKGKMPSLKGTYYHFRKLQQTSCAMKGSSLPSVSQNPIRKFGPRLQFANLDDDIHEVGFSSTSGNNRNTATVPVTMHVRLTNGTELAFATADPEKFVGDLIMKATELT